MSSSYAAIVRGMSTTTTKKKASWGDESDEGNIDGGDDAADTTTTTTTPPQQVRILKNPLRKANNNKKKKTEPKKLVMHVEERDEQATDDAKVPPVPTPFPTPTPSPIPSNIIIPLNDKKKHHQQRVMPVSHLEKKVFLPKQHRRQTHTTRVNKKQANIAHRMMTSNNSNISIFTVPINNAVVAMTMSKFVNLNHLSAVLNGFDSSIFESFVPKDIFLKETMTVYEGAFAGVYIGIDLVKSYLVEFLASNGHGQMLTFISSSILPCFDLHQPEARMVHEYRLSQLVFPCMCELTSVITTTFRLCGKETVSSIFSIVDLLATDVRRTTCIPVFESKMYNTSDYDYVRYVLNTMLTWTAGCEWYRLHISNVLPFINHVFNILRSTFIVYSTGYSSVLTPHLCFSIAKHIDVFGESMYLFLK